MLLSDTIVRCGMQKIPWYVSGSIVLLFVCVIMLCIYALIQLKKI